MVTDHRILSEIESRSELSHSAWKKGIGVERMNVRERRVQRISKNFKEKIKDLQQKLLSYREENERLTAENIYLLMEPETNPESCRAGRKRNV
jgi:hypothetical protein